MTPVFPIDTKREVIFREKSGVLSFREFRQDGMGAALFRDLPEDDCKEVKVHFVIDAGNTPRLIEGLHKLCERGSPSSSEEETDSASEGQ